MMQAALYIVSGAAVYGAGHHLYLGASHSQDQHPHVLLGVMYLMLAAFALTSAPTYTTTAITTLLPLGKVTVAMGLLLWGTLAWFISAYTQVKPRGALAGLTATWCVFVIANLGSSNSLLYSEVRPIPPSQWGTEPLRWSASYSTWWTFVEAAMVLTLAYAFYAVWRFHQSGQRRPAMVMTAGLSVLGATAVFDILTRAHLLQFEFLAPFGFLALLATGSFYPRLIEQAEAPAPRGERDVAEPAEDKGRAAVAAAAAAAAARAGASSTRQIARAVSTELAQRPPPRPQSVVGEASAAAETPPLAAPAAAPERPEPRPETGTEAAQPQPAATATPTASERPPVGEETQAAPATQEPTTAQAEAAEKTAEPAAREAETVEVIPARRREGDQPRRRSTDHLPIVEAAKAEAARAGAGGVCDETDIRILWQVSESLMHIAVYSEMAVRNITRGEPDLRRLEDLCRRVHNEALEARRLASQMPHDSPRRPAPPDDD